MRHFRNWIRNEDETRTLYLEGVEGLFGISAGGSDTSLPFLADSTATTVAHLREDCNRLLDALRTTKESTITRQMEMWNGRLSSVLAKTVTRRWPTRARAASRQRRAKPSCRPCTRLWRHPLPAADPRNSAATWS